MSYRNLTTKSLSVVIFIVAITLSSSVVKWKSYKSTDMQYDDSNDLSLYQEYNDTCGREVMEMYECDEPGCTDQAGLINYIYIQKCMVSKNAGIVLYFVWSALLCYIIFILATTADKYFCVALTDMVEKMNIPPSIAGVTFLSFGNGGPDVFALMSAVLSGHMHIGMGSNLGAGLFITTIITGVVAFISDCKVNKLSFYRDIITYIISMVYLILVFFDKQIKMWEVIGFLVIYAVYVIVVIAFRKQSSDIYEVVEVRTREGSREKLLTDKEVKEIVGTTGLSVTAKVKVMSEPMYSVRHMVKEMVIDEFDDENGENPPILPESYKSTRSLSSLSPCISTSATPHLPNIMEEAVVIEEKEVKGVEKEEVKGEEKEEVKGEEEKMEKKIEKEEKGEVKGEEEKMEKKEEKREEKEEICELINEKQAEDELQEPLLPQTSTNILHLAKEEIPTVKTSKWSLFKCYAKKEWDFFLKLSILKKIVYILEIPFIIGRNFTIPVVMEERYNKFSLLSTSFGMPLFIFIKSEQALTDSYLGIPYWVILLVSISAIFTVFWCYAPWDRVPPKWLFFTLLFVSFFMSIIWISEIADELVAIMNALGLFAGIEQFVMGLTILAVGNSVSDLVGDVTITKQGYPQMAIGGIYACTPMFSLLVGLGIALAIRMIETGSCTLGDDTVVINLTFIFILITLVSTLIVVPLQNYTYTKKFGIYLICLYLVSMLLNVLAAMGILKIPFLEPHCCVCKKHKLKHR